MKVVEEKSSTGGNQKAPMFGAKVGFVIPKNKLSGSLVPVFRGGKKSGSTDAVNNEKNMEKGRKTKWGPDLTQDPFVRKGRLLAYQTRVDQITQLIQKKDLGNEVDPDTEMESLDADNKSSHPEIDNEELEKLKLERREIIGEILNLNPSYKAPSDYVPLLKEARVSIPIKEHPEYNFLGLLFGSGSDTLKRLEKETGAKIRVFGNRVDSTEEVEITSDRKGNQDKYSDLYALILADTFEKVDSAVALVELLVTPASGPTFSGTNLSILGQTSDSINGVTNIAATVQPPERPTQISLSQVQYYPAPRPVYSQGSTSLIGLSTDPASNAPTMSDISVPPSIQQPYMQSSMQPYMPQVHSSGQAGPLRYPPVTAPHPFPSQPNLSNFQFSGGQPTSIGMPSLVRPQGTSLPQHAPNLPSAGQSYQLSSSAGWPGSTPNNSMAGAAGIPAQGIQNIGGHHPPVGTYPASAQIPSVAPLPTPSVPNFAMQSPLARGPIAVQSPNPAYRPGPVQPAPLPSPTVSSFPRATLPTGISPRIQFPSSGDLAFKHQQPQNSAGPVNIWPGVSAQNNPSLRPPMQLPSASRAPPPPHDVINQVHRPPVHGFLRPPADDQFGQFRPHLLGQNSPDFFRRPSFTPVSQMDEMALNRSRLMVSMHGSQPPRSTQFQQDYPSPVRPVRNLFNSNPSFQPGRPAFRPTGGQQVYDPFSPTAVANPHQQKAPNLAKPNNQEGNPDSRI